MVHVWSINSGERFQGHHGPLVCLCETHTDDTDIVDITSYTFLSKNRNQPYKRKSGGIGLYVRYEIAPFLQVLLNDSKYALWISISKRFTSLDKNLILCTLYIPPENSRFLNEEHYSLLENEISSKCAVKINIYLPCR